MYPTFELRLSFIQKVYSIVTFQLLVTIAVVSFFLFVPPVANFYNNYIPDYVPGIIALFAYFSVEYNHKHQKQPLSYFFLLIFTVSYALVIGSVCTLPSGKIILEAVTLTTVVVINLSIYTFWAAKRGHDFNYLSTFLDGSLSIVFLLILVKILYPSGNLLFMMIFGWLASITFYGYIVYNTDNLIKRFTYAKYISMCVDLYLDVIAIFLCVLIIFGVAELIKKQMYCC